MNSLKKEVKEDGETSTAKYIVLFISRFVDLPPHYMGEFWD